MNKILSVPVEMRYTPATGSRKEGRVDIGDLKIVQIPGALGTKYDTRNVLPAVSKPQPPISPGAASSKVRPSELLAYT